MNQLLNYLHLDVVEIIGLCATTLVLISLCQSNTKRLRIINAIGSVVFVVYGLWKGALSVWVLNGICAIVNIYKLIKMTKSTPQE